uniref:Ig-like domain-containing protein n=1 Tax=Fundulus heteroclitus TaxID=8078 RepID=A0A3Q2SSI6_FUNHE
MWQQEWRLIRPERLSNLLLSSCGDPVQLIASVSYDVTLPCHDPNHPLIVVQWNRADLGSAFVLRYRDRRFDEENQHPSFKNRVDLQDRQMKDGNVSLVLENVTANDNGTYECRVQRKGTRERLKISVISLHVLLPGELLLLDQVEADFWFPLGCFYNMAVAAVVGLSSHCCLNTVNPEKLVHSVKLPITQKNQ